MSQLARAMTEDELLQAITEAATLYGWMWHHVRRSDKAQQMGHSGFPDLVLARKGRVAFLELKRAGGALSEGQVAWADALDPEDGVGRGHLYATVWPTNLDTVLRWLAGS